MHLYTLGNLRPQLGKNIFLAPGAMVIGNVQLGDNVSLWFHTIARGDVDRIEIGENTNIQDLSMLHVSEGYPLILGKNISVGHKCMLHGCSIGEGSLIGMGAVIMDGVKVGRNTLVAAGTLLTPGREFPEGVLLKGSPGKVIRDLTPLELKSTQEHHKRYLKYADRYRLEFKEMQR